MARNIMVTALLLAFLSPALAQDLTGKEIIEKVNEIINPQTMQGVMTMVIETSSGQERTFVYESFSKDQGENGQHAAARARRRFRSVGMNRPAQFLTSPAVASWRMPGAPDHRCRQLHQPRAP